jgi:hypothetical protein
VVYDNANTFFPALCFCVFSLRLFELTRFASGVILKR